MTRYIGGCFCCGGSEGKFQSWLPNGVCSHPRLAGAYFCDDCVEKIKKSSNLLKELIKKWENTWEGFGYISHTFCCIKSRKING